MRKDQSGDGACLRRFLPRGRGLAPGIDEVVVEAEILVEVPGQVREERVLDFLRLAAEVFPAQDIAEVLDGQIDARGRGAADVLVPVSFVTVAGVAAGHLDRVAVRYAGQAGLVRCVGRRVLRKRRDQVRPPERKGVDLVQCIGADSQRALAVDFGVAGNVCIGGVRVDPDADGHRAAVLGHIGRRVIARIARVRGALGHRAEDRVLGAVLGCRAVGRFRHRGNIRAGLDRCADRDAAIGLDLRFAAAVGGQPVADARSDVVAVHDHRKCTRHVEIVGCGRATEAGLGFDRRDYGFLGRIETDQRLLHVLGGFLEIECQVTRRGLSGRRIRLHPRKHLRQTNDGSGDVAQLDLVVDGQVLLRSVHRNVARNVRTPIEVGIRVTCADTDNER